MEEQVYYSEEIDLRKLVRALLRGWKWIIIGAMLLGAAGLGYSLLQPPVYEATALVSIDAEALGLSIDPQNILLSDATRQGAAEILEVPIEIMPKLPLRKDDQETDLPVVLISKREIGSITYEITIQSEDAVFACEAATAWADAGIDLVLAYQNSYFDEEERNSEVLEEADRALLQYLEEKNLERWTWTDLAILTGIGSQPTLMISTSPGEQGGVEEAGSDGWAIAGQTQESTGNVYTGLLGLPPISAAQHEEIITLMRERIVAEMNYNQARDTAASLKYSTETQPPQLLNAAQMPERPVSPKILLNTALGLVLGTMIGVLLVFVMGWFTEPEKNIKK